MNAIPALTLTSKSERGLTKVIQGTEHMAQDVFATAPLAVAELTTLLAEALKRRFAEKHPGRSDEDRAGEHEGRYGGGFWGDQHPRTVDTVESSSHGLVGRVTMAGGAPYIEFGTPDHPITPHGAYPLHWREAGEDYFSAGHEVSGVEADDFAGRAIEDVEAEAVISSIFSRTFLSIIKELE